MNSGVALVRQALGGLAAMSVPLQRAAEALLVGTLPAQWMASSYPSVKPLGAYMSDLVQRCAMLAEWALHGAPPLVWLPGLFFTQAFLTGEAPGSHSW